MLSHLKDQNLGWAENIIIKLREYNLESDWEVIRTKTKGQWKMEVMEAANEKKQTKAI